MALIQPKTGFHTGSSGGNLDGITADYIIPLLHSGKDVTIVAADTTAGLYDACVAAKNYQNTTSVLCWRRTDQRKNGGFDFDALANNFSLSPEQNAELHWQAYQQEIPPELVQYKDILELIVLNEIRGQNTNEPVYDDLHIGEYLGRFALHYRTLTDWRLLFFGFASGEPDIDVWEQPSMLNFLRLCGERPHDMGIALHEYSYTISDILDGYPYKIGRYQFLHDVCDDNGIARPRIVISEWGWALDDAPAVPQAMADIETVYREYAKHPNIAGGAIWWLGPDFGGIANKIQPLIKPLGEYIIATNYDVEVDTPQPPDNGQGGTVTEEAIQSDNLEFPRIDDLRQQIDNVRIVVQSRVNGSWAHNDHVVNIPIVAKPGVERRVVVQKLRSVSENHNPPDPQPPPALPYLDVSPLSQRDPIWANVALGEPTGHGKTIGNWGCLLVAYNMLARYWNITDRFPGAENAHYVSVGAFSNQYIQPAALRTAYPNQVAYDGYLTRDSSAMRPKIREWIDNGWPVACRVDFIPSTAQWDQHWVLVNGYIGDTDFYMADPWHGDIAVVNDRYPIAGSDILEAIFYWPKGETKPPDPPTPPPTGATIDVAPYFVPEAQYGHKIVMQTGSSTQPMQLEKRTSDVILRKGDGNWIDGTKYQDSEQWRVKDGQVQKGIDTSDAGNGGRDGYDLAWAQWIPQIVEVGKTYHSTPTVRRFDRANCGQTTSTGQANDYLYIKALLPTWTSPANAAITLNDVLVIEWRSGTADLNVPPNETYYFAKKIGYCGWGSHFVQEITEGQQPLVGKLDCGM